MERISSSPGPSHTTVTELLLAWSRGDLTVQDELMSRVYHELRRLASRYLRRERSGHTLGTTALVHEAYLRLVDQRTFPWQSRTHFLAIAAQMMRRILVDQARRRSFRKRGGDRGAQLSLDHALELPLATRAPDLVALDDALDALEAAEPVQARLVELRFFAGLSVEETAEVLAVSPATVDRRWRLAKAWLFRAMQPNL
jgi:RNA polymerase sigma factor (TIGR02999 family)